MKRGAYKSSSIKILKLEILLRGSDYIAFDQLKEQLGCKDRTLFYYLNKLKKLEGFTRVSKPILAYRIMDTEISTSPGLTEEEYMHLVQLLKDKKITENLRKKFLAIISQSRLMSLHLHSQIQAIRNCMKEKKMVSVKKYHRRADPINPQQNIELIPLHFDEANYRLFARYRGSKDGEVYTFNLENMEEITASELKYVQQSYKPKKEDSKKDVFGFSLNTRNRKNPIKVELLLSHFAYSQLFRQFPKLIKYIIRVKHNISNKYTHHLVIAVNDIQPIARFASGLLNEIKIEGSPEAKNEIWKYLKERFFEGVIQNYNQPEEKNEMLELLTRF
jgi:hypothetical protein